MQLAVLVTAISLALLGCTGESTPAAPSEQMTVADEEPVEDVEQPTTTAASTSLDGRVANLPDDCTDYESNFLVRDGSDRVVQVALVCEHDGELQLVGRVVSRETDQLIAIVEQLFLGTTPDETAAGLDSSFSSYTAGQFSQVRLGDDGVVVIDLGPGFVTANNFSTSFMSGQVFGQIAASMFTVSEVTGVDFTLNGQRWCGWEAGPCESVPRPVIPRH